MITQKAGSDRSFHERLQPDVNIKRNTGIPPHRPPADRLSTQDHQGALYISESGHARRCTHRATRPACGTIVRARRYRIEERPAGGMSVELEPSVDISTDLPANRPQPVGAQLSSLLRTQCRPQVGGGVMAKKQCLPSLPADGDKSAPVGL